VRSRISLISIIYFTQPAFAAAALSQPYIHHSPDLGYWAD
jgi:hypothetical protein